MTLPAGGMGTYLSAATDEKFNLVAAPYPVLKKGDTPKIVDCSLECTGKFSAISSSCKDIEKAIKFHGHAYSEEESMLYNFGIEGESHKMVDGYPTYTDNMTHNSGSKTMPETMSAYLRTFESGPFVQDRKYMGQYAVTPEQRHEIEVWQSANASKYLLPYIYTERLLVLLNFRHQLIHTMRKC